MYAPGNQDDLAGLFGTIKKIGKGAVKVGKKAAPVIAGAGLTYATGNPAFLASSTGLLKDTAGNKVSMREAAAYGAIPGAQNSAYPYPLGFSVPPETMAQSAGYQQAYPRQDNTMLYVAGGGVLLLMFVMMQNNQR